VKNWYLNWGKQRKNSSCKLDFLFLHFGLAKGALDHLCSDVARTDAIQMLLNCISKLQGLLCLVPNDWIQYFTSKVWNEPFHLQGTSPIKPTASLQISKFYNLFHVFQLKLLAAPVPLASHFSLKQSWLDLNWFAFVAIFHRKMIPKGQLLLLQSVDIFKFDCENITSSLVA